MGGAAAGWLSAYVRSRGLGFELREVHGEPTPLRASGTEPVVRVYVEAQNEADVQAILAEATSRVRALDIQA